MFVGAMEETVIVCVKFVKFIMQHVVVHVHNAAWLEVWISNFFEFFFR